MKRIILASIVMGGYTVSAQALLRSVVPTLQGLGPAIRMVSTKPLRKISLEQKVADLTNLLELMRSHVSALEAAREMDRVRQLVDAEEARERNQKWEETRPVWGRGPKDPLHQQ